MSRMYEINRTEVDVAWEAVCRADGGAGYDGVTIEQVTSRLDDELYKIWNRLSSGSYQAQPVKIVRIPKAKGGERVLGIPTVTDRVAQTVIKNRLEKEVDPHFHRDSYAYRPHKSAIDAVLKARERCMRTSWVLEVDIRGFFDHLDHELMLEILSRYTQDKLVLLYIKKFLKAKSIEEDGEQIERLSGTPQGGVVSPVISNLFLHEAFDTWMQETYPSVEFERYADDLLIHCTSEKIAQAIKDQIEARLKQYKLELHPEKTRIVYTGTSNDHNSRGHGLPRKFTFLGYDFKPRDYKGRTVFTPGMGQGALKVINLKLKSCRLGSMMHGSIEKIAGVLNPKLRGWINYYGHSRRSELYKLADLVNRRLASWLNKKLNIRLHGKSWDELKRLKHSQPKLFVHWYMIAQPSTRRAV